MPRIKASSTPQVIIDEVVVKQVAAIAMTGASCKEIARQLDCAPALVKKVLDSEAFKQFLEKVVENEIVPAVLRVRSQLTKLGDKAIKVIEQHLEEGSLQAAITVITQILPKKEDLPQDAQITIVMPGAEEPKTIEVDNVD